MENNSIDSTPLRPDGDRTIDASLVNIDMAAYIKQIREEETWANSDRNAITVFKSKMMRILLIALHKNAEMKEHQAPGNISVQVIEGEMLFSTKEQSVVLKAGQIIALHENIPHSVQATTETVFLLTMTN